MISEEIVHIKGIPKKVIVFLHGYQDSAEHIERRTEKLQNLQNVALHIPQAPFINEVDISKRQWYSIHQFDPDDKRRVTASWNEFIELYNRMTVGLEEANYYILEYIDNILNEYGLSYEDVFLCGFSQGAMCAIYSGLMCPYKMAGVISFSGILAAEGYVSKHIVTPQNFLLLHGKDDDKVRFEALDFTSERLKSLGCEVISNPIENVKHRLASEAVDIAYEFIKKSFK